MDRRHHTAENKLNQSTTPPLFNKEITMFFTFIRRKNLKKLIDHKIRYQISDSIEKLSEESIIKTITSSGRTVYYSSDTLKSLVEDIAKEIINSKIHEIAKRVNDDLNRESLIDSIIERINDNQQASKRTKRHNKTSINGMQESSCIIKWRYQPSG
jgi:excinuclease UvrABC ATPase subunit